MNSIKKFEEKVKNAKKFNSPELRLTFEEAQQIVDEIKLLESKPAEIIYKEIEVPVPVSTTATNTVVLDGGAF